MSLLHPSEEDAAFALANADAGLKKALMRLNELADLLEEARPHVPAALQDRIGVALSREYRDAHYEPATQRPWEWERKRA